MDRFVGGLESVNKHLKGLFVLRREFGVRAQPNPGSRVTGCPREDPCRRLTGQPLSGDCLLVFKSA